MSLFRSEEHLERWLMENEFEYGRVLSLPEVWELARAWYLDPREESWAPRTREESQAVLNSLGLDDEFWTF